MKGWLRAFLWMVGILAVIAAVLRIFFVDFYRVPTDESAVLNWANAPSLEPGDLVLVWRRGEPHVGDLVQCTDPTTPTNVVVARIVASSGETVEQAPGETVRLNHFRVNASACSFNTPRTVRDEYGTDVAIPCSGEELGTTKHDVYTLPDAPGIEPVTVEPGKVFLLSDTRIYPWSHDSRDPAVGQVPVEWCSRRLVLRLWSKKGWSDAARRLTFLF